MGRFCVCWDAAMPPALPGWVRSGGLGGDGWVASAPGMAVQGEAVDAEGVGDEVEVLAFVADGVGAAPMEWAPRSQRVSSSARLMDSASLRRLNRPWHIRVRTRTTEGAAETDARLKLRERNSGHSHQRGADGQRALGPYQPASTGRRLIGPNRWRWIMEVALTEDESSVLQQALQSYLSGLRDEISHTDDRKFRSGLQRERDTLEGIFGKLGEASSTTELRDDSGAVVVRLVSLWWSDDVAR